MALLGCGYFTNQTVHPTVAEIFGETVKLCRLAWTKAPWIYLYLLVLVTKQCK